MKTNWGRSLETIGHGGKVLIKNGATARILSNEKPTAGNIFGQPLFYSSYYSISELQNCLFPNICSFNTECPVLGMNFSRSVSNYCSTPHTKLLELVSMKSECFSSLSTSISYILIPISISISILHISRSISNQIAASAFHSLILHPGVHNTHSFGNTIG